MARWEDIPCPHCETRPVIVSQGLGESTAYKVECPLCRLGKWALDMPSARDSWIRMAAEEEQEMQELEGDALVDEIKESVSRLNEALRSARKYAWDIDLKIENGQVSLSVTACRTLVHENVQYTHSTRREIPF